MSGRGAERILDVIEWMAVRPSSASLTDLVQALDLPKSSALLLLRSLVKRGYVDRLPDGRYLLVRLPGEVSAESEAWGTIVRIAALPLSEAVATAQESGFVAVLDDYQVRYLNKMLPSREIRYDRDITRLRVAHQVASGIVLLGELDDEQLKRHLESLPLSQGQRPEIGSAIKKARDDGYAVNLEGVVEGAAGVAAPVRDARGAIVAALNIAGPRDRLNSNLDQTIEAVVIAARTVSLELQRRTLSANRNKAGVSVQ